MTRLLAIGLLFWLGGLVSANATISVTDDTGRLISLAQPARRIVTLSPHATELVYAAGAGDRLVAVASYSDWPPEALEQTSIGSFGGLDRERMLLLAPDLVIAWDSGNRPGDLAWLQHMGIAVFRSEPKRLEQIADSIAAIGRLAASEAVAQPVADMLRRQLAQPCPRPPLRGFVQLSDATLLTVGRRHWMNQALALAGVQNIFADQPRAVFTVGLESVLARQPLLHLAIATIDQAWAPQLIALDPRYWSRPGPRLLRGIKQLCHQLLPGATPAGLALR